MNKCKECGKMFLCGVDFCDENNICLICLEVEDPVRHDILIRIESIKIMNKIHNRKRRIKKWQPY